MNIFTNMNQFEGADDFADGFCNELKSVVDNLSDALAGDEAVATFATEMMGTCNCAVKFVVKAGKYLIIKY